VPVVKKGRFEWTPELEAKLWGLFEYGLRARDVAEEMGISICAAEARYRKLKKLNMKEQVK
jgi:hypothetical protein